MGEVYEARDAASGQHVALKRLRAEALKKASTLKHFRAEYRALAALEHPRIIEVYRYGLDGELPYYSMELLDGEDLRKLAPLPHAEACKYLRDVASSIALLHARELVHRDLSPRNVRRTSDGRCKLIDFGTMVPFGKAPNIAGTAPLVAPEAVRGDPLDQRTDLYSLGALAYSLLTGRHAFPARNFKQLIGLWLEPPPRLRSVDDSIPRALDELVLSLLHLDPMGRPGSAAAVIELLGSFAEPAPDETPEVARSYLARTALVGREEQQVEIERRLRRIAEGRGTALLVQGLAGEGKSRLLQDSIRSAETLGLLTVGRGARTLQGDRVLARALAAELLTAAPNEAREAMDGDHAVLERLLEPGLHRADPDVVTQEALGGWFERVARCRPLLVAVDDLDHADPFSSAFIAALALRAPELPMLVLATSGPDAADIAGAAYEAFADASPHIVLSALNEAQTLQQVTSSFGVVPNVRHVASWLFRNARGNPAMTIELMRHLANRGVVRYARGTWTLPDTPITEDAPQELHRALSMHLSSLSDAAQTIAQLLACHGQSAEASLLERASGLPAEVARDATLELIDGGLLDAAGSVVSFTLDATRAAVDPQDDPRRSRKLHAALAEVLLEPGSRDDYRDLRGGWHLSHTERELEGARILARVGPRLIRSATGKEHAARAMERALQIFERHAEPLAARLELASYLVNLGYLWNPELTNRYAHETLATLYRVSGLERAGRWVRWLPAPVATLLSLLLTQLQRLFSPRALRPPTMVRSLVCFGRALVATAAVRAFTVNPKGAAALVRFTDPLASARIPGASLSATFARTLAMQPLGKEHEVAQRHALTQQRVSKLDARRTPGITAEDIEELFVGALLMRSMYRSYEAGPGGLELAQQLEDRGSALAVVAAERVRMVYYLVRGRWEEAEATRHRIELHGIQGGSVWQVRAFALPLEGGAGAVYGNVVAVRRSLDHLEKAAVVDPALATMRDMVRAGYHYSRGEHARAVELGTEFIARHPPHSIAGWAMAYAVVGAALVELDRAQEAREICRGAWNAVHEEDRRYFAMYMPLEGALALAEGACGNTEESNRLFQQAEARLGASDEPTVVATLHEYRVRLAQRTKDRDALREALRAMAEVARASGSPTLAAHVDRVSAIASRSTLELMERLEVDSGEDTVVDHQGAPPGDLVTQVLTRVDDPDRRALHALRVIAQSAGASCGYMMTPGDPKPALVARLSPREPAAALEQAMGEFLTHGRAGTQRQLRVPTAGEDEHRIYHLLLLPGAKGSAAVVALEGDREGLMKLGAGLVAQVGEALESPFDALVTETLRQAESDPP